MARRLHYTLPSPLTLRPRSAGRATGLINMATKRIEYFDENGDEQSADLPAAMEVCDRCNGEGVHDHPAFSNGLTREDFDEDTDFAESYFYSRYDVCCSRCKGLRVVAVVNEAALNAEQRAAWACFLSDEADRAQSRREEAAERRTGC